MTMVSRDVAYAACLSEMKNPLAAKVTSDKYLLCDENGSYVEKTPKEMWRRLAVANSAAEKEEVRTKWADSFTELLTDFKFVPGGRILYGLGNQFVRITLKNCYVLGIKEDSIKGIFDLAYWMAETYKAGGGTGTDLSPLRPKGSPIKNAARVSTGAPSFAGFYSHITGMIGQKARIGALLLCIDISHPDVEDFISMKGDDLDKVRYANISIKITDDFMRAVEKDGNFDLRWGGKTYQTIKARDLWKKIVHYAWKRAEPGILFWDKICKELPAHNYAGFETIATNPCVTGDMRLKCQDGYRTFRDLWHLGGCQEYDGSPTIIKHGNLKIVNRNGLTNATNVYRTSIGAEIFRITLKNGVHIDATKNHKFIVKGYTDKIELHKLSIGSELYINKQSGWFGSYNYPEYAELAGWVVGDGSIVRVQNEYIRAIVRCWGLDIENVLPKLRNLALSVYKKSNKSTNQSPKFDGFDHTPEGFNIPVKEFVSTVLGRLMAEDGLIPGNKHHVPTKIWDGTEETVAAFLRGLFSADGSIQVNEKKRCISVRISQVRHEILSECQLLLNQFGITSTVHFERRKKSKQLMNNGKGGMELYNRKAEHELIISGRNNVEQFINKIGFIQDWKNKIANIWLSAHLGSNNSEVKFTSEIVSIKYIGIEETFCLTEPINNLITINGFDTGNCAEACLSHGDSCNLGSMNLGRYVRNSFTKDAMFDFEQFDKDVRIGVRFLDNIISLEKTPLDFQQWANDNGRRLGLGIMGLADVFLKIGIRYDSDEAMTLTDKIMNNFMLSSYDASCDLAIEKGPFPVFNAETHFKSDFINRLPDWLKTKIKKTGIRNIAVHAIAPTGSLSCIAQCSSGIEPVFRMRHIRKTNLGTAKEVEEHVVIHSMAEEYLKLQAEQMAKKHGKITNSADQPLPAYFVSAHEISPDRRIILQSIIQKYIDQSISQTVNLPKDATEEQIGQYYMEAWKKGLKGITVYREGSREGVLVAINEKEKNEREGEIQVHQAPKRPNELKGRVHIIKPNGKRYTIFVGLMGERVYEVFALEHKQAGVGDEMEGIIKKTKSDDADTGNIYSFESGLLTVRHLNRYEDQEASLITRLISTALRHGTPLEFIIHQINCSKIPMSSFAKAICRALSLYVKEEDTKGKFKCPSCGSKNVRFHGMCYTCEDCASSKCS